MLEKLVDSRKKVDIVQAYEGKATVKETYIEMTKIVDTIFQTIYLQATDLTALSLVESTMRRTVKRQVYRNNAVVSSPENYFIITKYLYAIKTEMN